MTMIATYCSHQELSGIIFVFRMSSPGGNYDNHRRPSLLQSHLNKQPDRADSPSAYSNRFHNNYGQLGVANIPSMAISSGNQYLQDRRPSSIQRHGPIPMKTMWNTKKEDEKTRFKETKSKLMRELEAMETKIDNVEKEIKQKMLKKEQLEAEEKKRSSRTESQTDDGAEEDEIELEGWQKIYSENRKEAAKNQHKFDHLNLELTENGLTNTRSV